MGDSKSKKTITKLGKFFGVSTSNLQSADEVSDDLRRTVLVGEGKGNNGREQTQEQQISHDEDFILSMQENDNVSPLPKDGSVQGVVSNTRNNGNIKGGSGAKSANNSSSSLNNLGASQEADGGTHENIGIGGIVPRSQGPSPKSNAGNNISTAQNTHNRVSSPVHSSTSSDDNFLLQPQPQVLTSISSAYENNLSNANLQSINSGTSMSIRSPPMSRSSSTLGVSTKKPANPASGKPPTSTNSVSNSLSRTSSFKAKIPASKERDPTISVPSPSPAPVHQPRFKMLENGSHEHHLKSTKRQEKLSNMLKGLLGSKKLRDEAKSAVPNILQSPQHSQSQLQSSDKPPTLFAGLVNQVKNNTSPYHGPVPGLQEQHDCRSFVEKYGRCQEIIGRGSFGVVRISHKKVPNNTSPGEEVIYAVKEFKRRPNESEKKYNRRLTSEFCISSSLKNMNIIDTLDLLKDAEGDYCEVMEFCSGGDLYTLIITSGKLEYAEADCFFKQLIRGVNYMHDMGVSHRDLKPENLLLTQNGILKITDFGNGECFKMAWENEVQYSEGICGSSPYIAPEEFSQQSFDPRGVDIWACGVIYMAMRTGRQLWKLANPQKDVFFEEYLLKRKDASGYEPIESLKRARCRNVIYSILDPKPERRINGKQILSSEWGREIKVCDAGEGLFHADQRTLEREV